jgi:ribonuclease HI
VSDAHPIQVYTDGSACNNRPVAAYFVSRRTFAAQLCSDAPDQAPDGTASFMAELSAIDLALTELEGRLSIHTDHTGLVRLMRCARTGTTFTAAATKFPRLASVRDSFDARHCTINHCRGHGEHAPPGIRVADQLARALAKRADRIEPLSGGRIDASTFSFGTKGSLLARIQLAFCRFDQGMATTLHAPSFSASRVSVQPVAV